MITPRSSLTALLWLLPAAALAHSPGEHPADPNLHVDGSLEDCSVRLAPGLSQADFGRFVREFGSISAFKQMSSPRPLGRWGVAVGLEWMSFAVDEYSAAWNDTFAHPDAYHELGSPLEVPRLRARLGIAEALEVGAYYSVNPEANYGFLGLEARYGLLRQDEAMPVSLAVRGAYTKTLYVEDMDMHAVTGDVSVGRTFWGLLTPYVGAGSDLVLARETTDNVELQRETQVALHALGGLELRYWHVALGAEVQVGPLTAFQLQFAGVF